jgi:hypothetical protein
MRSLSHRDQCLATTDRDVLDRPLIILGDFPANWINRYTYQPLKR